jgi:hypothetical protein
LIYEAAHQIGALPIVWVFLFRRKATPAMWFLALAFFVSWFADSAAHFIGGSWAGRFVWLPLQLWLASLAFTKERGRRILYAFGLVFLAFASASISWPGPDIFLTLLGSIGLLWIARGKLALPVYIYFGAGSLAYLMMVNNIGADFLRFWYLYQGCRLVAFAVFIGITAPPLISKQGLTDHGRNRL